MQAQRLAVAVGRGSHRDDLLDQENPSAFLDPDADRFQPEVRLDRINHGLGCTWEDLLGIDNRFKQFPNLTGSPHARRAHPGRAVL